jgi:hypothetical protein
VAKPKKLLVTAGLVAFAALAAGNGALAVPGENAPPAAGGDIAVKQRPVLTPQEMLTQSREYFKGMQDVVKRITDLQAQSKRQKDIIRLNCVTDKLVQSRVNVTIAEQSMASLQETIGRADEGGRAHEFTRLTIINQKVLVLGAEAENCIGEDLSFVGATRVDVDVDPSLPQIDVTTTPPGVIDITRPPKASPVTGT